jgi:hypothetical protein
MFRPTSSALHRAFLMHHEGLLVVREHPSLGLLSFIASIETLAAMRETLERCAECKVVIGSTARFKRAIATVRSEARCAVPDKGVRPPIADRSRLKGSPAGEYVAGGWGAEPVELTRPLTSRMALCPPLNEPAAHCSGALWESTRTDRSASSSPLRARQTNLCRPFVTGLPI